MKLLTSILIICGLGTSLAVQDKINKTQMIELLREGLYGKVDSVQWSPLVKEWVVDGYLQVPTTILRMNHVLNLLTKAVKKTEVVQLAKEKALKVIEIILKLSMKKAGSMINKLRYKIIVHFQDKGVPITTPSDLGYLDTTSAPVDPTTSTYENDTIYDILNENGYSNMFNDYTIDW
ncbi:uncharacterized protein LOC111592093 [Drosophila hydei]|uniref:Uncharacterized protein LOC111592093 n=1 Tax=Drosophila hydei TaxID=7224 RepID=A0A6J1L9K1_DROHY|nr:uncharacterized protein LOC111592093 [Drosophila hydei]